MLTDTRIYSLVNLWFDVEKIATETISTGQNYCLLNVIQTIYQTGRKK